MAALQDAGDVAVAPSGRRFHPLRAVDRNTSGDAPHDVSQRHGNSNALSGYVVRGDTYEGYVAIGGELVHV